MLALPFAADQFLVSPLLPDEPNGKIIIPGYHCLSDWTVAEVLRAWMATEPTTENSKF